MIQRFGNIISSAGKICIIVLILLLNLSIAESAGKKKSQSVRDRNKELQELYKSINETRNKLSKLNIKEKTELKSLGTMQQHIRDVNRYIALIDEEIDLLQDSINYQSMLLNHAGSNKQQLKKQFTKFLAKAYLKGSSQKEDFTVFNRNLENDLLNTILVKRFATGSVSRLHELDRYIDSTQLLVHTLYAQTYRQEELRKMKESEIIKLNNVVKSKKVIINDIRSNKKLLAAELAEKEKSARALQSIIARLSKAETKAAKEDKPVYERTDSKVVWPSSGRKILRAYGQYTNPVTGSVFDNPGIDIAQPSGSPVFASSSGIVSLTHWLPGYGSLVILDHGSNLRTVYANLSSVNVRKGDKVSAGKILGNSGESVDGEFVHFEVWQGSRKMNPLSFLR